MSRTELEVDGGFDAEAALAVQVAHTIPGCERTDAATGRHERLLRLGDELVPVVVWFAPVPALEVTPAFRDEVLPLVRRWLDLDANQAARTAALADDPLVGPLVAARPGMRVTGHPAPFEALVNTVVGQQISLAAARTMTGRLVSRFGEPGPTGLTAFPRAAVLAAAGLEDFQSLGFMAARARTLSGVARAVADGLDLYPSGAEALARTRADLLALPGIGPWTVEFLALRAFGDPDAFPAGDLVLHRALGVRTAAQSRRAAEGWRPWRAFATQHLWTAAAYLPPN